MRHLSYSTLGDPSTYFGSVRMAVQHALLSLGVELTKEQANPVVEALMDAFDRQKLVVLPHKPTQAMVTASMSALHTGTRPSVGWVDTPTKHQWRLYVAMSSAPDWRMACGSMPSGGSRTAFGLCGSERMPRRLSLPREGG